MGASGLDADRQAASVGAGTDGPVDPTIRRAKPVLCTIRLRQRQELVAGKHVAMRKNDRKKRSWEPPLALVPCAIEEPGP